MTFLQIAFAYGVCIWEKLRTMAKNLSRESFLFLKNEDMREPEKAISLVEKFLNISSNKTDFSINSNLKKKKAIRSITRLKIHYNLSKLTRITKINELSDWRFSKLLYKGFNSLYNIIDEVVFGNLLSESMCCKLSDELKTKLRLYYNEDIKLTEHLTGLNLQNWKLQRKE